MSGFVRRTEMIKPHTLRSYNLPFLPSDLLSQNAFHFICAALRPSLPHQFDNLNPFNYETIKEQQNQVGALLLCEVYLEVRIPYSSALLRRKCKQDTRQIYLTVLLFEDLTDVRK